VRDRKSLLIIRGGANVYPAEVERVLQEAPGVAACAVLGVPDERLGERVVAVVEPEPGAEVDDGAVRAHCEANLAKYKVPERFVVVDTFPRNAMGKIIRKDLPALL
jgi:acyl-CoA synthetase (AMP-forming)/AMP-acid ligase II